MSFKVFSVWPVLNLLFRSNPVSLRYVRIVTSVACSPLRTRSASWPERKRPSEPSQSPRPSSRTSGNGPPATQTLSCAVSCQLLIMTVFLSLVLSVSNAVDDEEEMLYGESKPLSSPSKEEPSRVSAALNSSQTGRESGQEPSHWCLLVRENGVMEVTNINTDLLRNHWKSVCY